MFFKQRGFFQIPSEYTVSAQYDGYLICFAKSNLQTHICVIPHHQPRIKSYPW